MVVSESFKGKKAGEYEIKSEEDMSFLADFEKEHIRSVGLPTLIVHVGNGLVMWPLPKDKDKILSILDAKIQSIKDLKGGE